MTRRPRKGARTARAPLLLAVPALVAGAVACLPLAYLVLRALDADPAQLAGIVFRPRNLMLLGNTVALVAAVLGLATLIALPVAWLVTRSDLRHRGLVTFLMALPLAVPGYVMAYALLGLSGYYGFARQWFGVTLPPFHGLWGAAVALALYTFPYLFLNLRAAFLGMDPALEETASSLGRGRAAVFRHILLPQLWPALLGGWIVVGLYVIGDFGAISLMRYDVFSSAIFSQYAGAFDRVYAAWLSLMLMALAGAMLAMQHVLSRNRRFARTGTGTARPARPVPLGRWRPVAAVCVGGVALASLGLPLLVLGHWMRLGLPDMQIGDLGHTAIRALVTAAPAAGLAVALALPVALLTTRHPGPLAILADRLAYLGYATPALAFALAMVFFALQSAPVLYQTLTLLVGAYAVHFVALALVPLRLALMQIGPRQEETARALGVPPVRAFMRVVLPRLRRPAVASGMLVFIMVVKELPIAHLLAPTGWRTLAMNVFARTSEGMMAEAAPFALALILFSACFVGLILKYEGASTR